MESSVELKDGGRTTEDIFTLEAVLLTAEQINKKLDSILVASVTIITLSCGVIFKTPLLSSPRPVGTRYTHEDWSKKHNSVFLTIPVRNLKKM